MTERGGQKDGRSRWSNLPRAELAHAGQVLLRLDDLAARQRLAIARLAAAELTELGREQDTLEAELRSVLERAGDGDVRAGEPATADEVAAVAAQSTRVRRACRYNLALLSHARRSVSLLLGFDEGAAYDRRARRLTPQPSRALVLAL